MSSRASLSAAADERKARLAKLKSLKRKQPDEYQDDDADLPDAPPTDNDVAAAILSGRNYDPTTKGPKLGFEDSPTAGQVTLETQAAELAERVKAEAAAADEADKPLDLFKLQPKKPNWDLKRDLERKLEVLNVRTENAIARLVRERIETAQKEARKMVGSAENAADGEAAGMEGSSLVEAMHVREREEEADREREHGDEELV